MNELSKNPYLAGHPAIRVTIIKLNDSQIIAFWLNELNGLIIKKASPFNRRGFFILLFYSF
jgi:hypothetical protein